MKKKVAHITFDMRIGGTEQVIYQLVEHTDPEKYDVSIVCLNQPIGPFGMQLQKKGYPIIAFDRQPGFDLKLVTAIRRFIIANQIDMLHCHQYSPYIYGVFASRLTHAKVIFTEHGRFYPDRRKLKRMLINPILSQFTDSITAISTATKNALIKYENFPGKRIHVIYNGIDASKFEMLHNGDLRQSFGFDEETFILGTVARLDPIKNHEMMINAFKIIHERFPNTALMIVGDGPERQYLESLISKLGLNRSIIITGFREDTPQFYNMMDLFLLTSFSEGTAMTLLEAMASAKPCIATDVGGNPEIVLDYQTGFIIPSNDEHALAQKIIQLLEDKSLRTKMGIAGRKRFEQMFTAAKMASEYQKLYDEL